MLNAVIDNVQEGLPKNFDPLASEQKLYNWWEAKGYFKPDEKAQGTPFTVSMPPPNVTGKLHMGHAMFVTIQDIMVRYQRMRGRPAFWVPGTDHAGIATQMVVEKMLAEKVLLANLWAEKILRKRYGTGRHNMVGTLPNSSEG